MKRGHGKRKGGKFEREICAKLSIWVSHGKRKDLFWRSAMSGGRATVARKRGDKLARQAGDISAIAPEGHTLTDRYYFELKNYRDIQLDQFCLGKGPMNVWWNKTTIEAEKYHKSPVLIVKGNHLPILVVTWFSNELNPRPRARISVKDPTDGGLVVCSLGFLEDTLKRKFGDGPIPRYRKDDRYRRVLASSDGGE